MTAPSGAPGFLGERDPDGESRGRFRQAPVPLERRDAGPVQPRRS